MKLIVTLEHCFQQTPDGVIWTKGAFTYSFFERYLAVFDDVSFFARIENVPAVPVDYRRAVGNHVSAIPLSFYHGPVGYVQQYRNVVDSAQSALAVDYAVVMRVPSLLAHHVWSMLRGRQQPFGVEVVGDPHEVFSRNGGILHPLRPFFRWFFTRRLKQQCADACAVAYVSSHILPIRYPVAPGSFSTAFSSVELNAASFSSQPRTDFGNGSIYMITVGSLAQLYKAPDILIQAVNTLIKGGVDLHLTFVGDGKYRPGLEQQVAQMGLERHIRFMGQLPAGKAIREQLDQAHLFVLPSRTEGLPRAMIEAMARGLPCIGSTVGGIPELLPPEDMVAPNDVNVLAEKIRDVIVDSARMARMSVRNLEKAKEYHEDILRTRRNAFYQYVKDRTLEWQRRTR